jgi:hypothetical protein
MRTLIIALIVLAATCSQAADTNAPTTQPSATTKAPVNTDATAPSIVSSTVAEAEPVIELPNIVPGAITTIHTEFSDGTPIFYAVIVPADFDANEEYPVFLAMPPGGQDLGTTFNVVDGWYRAQALERGWVVISPAAPNNVLWFQGSERYIEESVNETLAWLRPEGGQFHLGGVSNGGRSTFRALSILPERFASVTVFPS